MKKICKNCKWWDYSEDSLNPEGYGFCNIPQMVYRPQKDNMFYSKRSAPLVGENFGCIHFEAKEPEYNIPS